MASTAIDYERWHDGVPYDLEALPALQAEEREEVEGWLLARAGSDWRDLEGLLAIGTDRARGAVEEQLRHGRLEQRLAAARRLPPGDDALEAAREEAIVDGLRDAEWITGLSTAIDLAVGRPTPTVLDALFRAALRRESAVHAAAALAYLRGRASQLFDEARRPFYLRFVDDDPGVREAAFRELCAECGVDPEPYLGET